jgi:hypothetical protein
VYPKNPPDTRKTATFAFPLRPRYNFTPKVICSSCGAKEHRTKIVSSHSGKQLMKILADWPRLRVFLVVVLFLAAQLSAQAQPNPEAAKKLQAAVTLEQKGDLKAAEEAFDKFTKEFPNLGVGWFRLAHVRHAQGRFEESVAGHLKAAEFPSFKPISLYNAACAYARLKQADKAIETLKLAMDAGFADRDQLHSDTDLESLRSDERFSKLLPPILSGAALFAEPTRVIHTFDGEAAGDEFGWVARKIGDLDQDGVIDFVATAPGANNHTGKMYVYSSKSAELLFSAEGAGPGERFGNGASAAGDVNADGVPDLIVGAPQAGTGVARIFSGAGGKQFLEIEGNETAMRFGYKVTGVGDINGDGRGDLAITATHDSNPEATGACLICSGKDGTQLFEILGESKGGKFGSAVASFSGKSQTFLAVGAQDAGEGKRGAIYLYRLAAEGASLLHKWEAEESGRDLGQMFLSFPGDVDGDGLADLFCTDFGDSAAGQGAGRAFVFSTSTGKKLLDLKGTRPGENFGTSVSDAGDVNGDGVGDLIIGAWQNNEQARSGGKLYLYSCKDGKLLRTWTCKQAGDTLGFDAQGIGDVDGDGAIDFLVTSAWSNTKGAKTGRVFILAGDKYPSSK